MNTEQFKWWLHGWMEIQNPPEIPERQFIEIKNHLKLVQKENSVINDNFINWLFGFIDANPDLKELNKQQTRRVKEKLSICFKKVTPVLESFKKTLDNLPNEIKGVPYPNNLKHDCRAHEVKYC